MFSEEHQATRLFPPVPIIRLVFLLPKDISEVILELETHLSIMWVFSPLHCYYMADSKFMLKFQDSSFQILGSRFSSNIGILGSSFSIMLVSLPHRWYSLADWNQSGRVGNIKQANPTLQKPTTFPNNKQPKNAFKGNKHKNEKISYFCYPLEMKGGHVLAKCCGGEGIEV